MISFPKQDLISSIECLIANHPLFVLALCLQLHLVPNRRWLNQYPARVIQSRISSILMWLMAKVSSRIFHHLLRTEALSCLTTNSTWFTSLYPLGIEHVATFRFIAMWKRQVDLTMMFRNCIKPQPWLYAPTISSWSLDDFSMLLGVKDFLCCPFIQHQRSL